MVEPTAAVALTAEELDLLIHGLDALEYWELGDRLPRNNGEVFIPGDMPPEHDRYWGPEPDPSEDAQEAIEQVRRCRALAHRLRAIELVDDREDPDSTRFHCVIRRKRV